MFRSTYKNTLKNLLRSPTFWLILAFLVGICVYHATRTSYLKYLIETGETISDMDPRWVYEYNTYICHNTNSITNVCLYAMPLFTIVTVVIILKRDYTDNFYEIEKAAGAKSGSYLSARLAAILTVNLVVVTLAVFFTFHLFTVLRSLPEGYSLGAYFADSTVRLLRLLVVLAFPCVLFYTGLAFGIGHIARSSLLSSIGSIIYVVAYFVVKFFFSLKLMFEYGLDPFAWLPALPTDIINWYIFYDTEQFENFVARQSFGDVIFAWGIMIVSFALFYVLSYLRQRKRTT